jgi:hypothetical protein
MKAWQMDEAIRSLVDNLRHRLSGMTEPQAIDFICDRLNLQLLRFHGGPLTEDQQAAAMVMVASIYELKQLTRILREHD